MKAEKEQTAKNVMHMAVIVFFMFIFKLLPPFAAITSEGMEILGIFLGAVYGWCFYSLLWTSLLGILAFGFTKTFTMAQAFGLGFGDEFVIMVVGLLFIAAYINQSGSSMVIVSWLVKRKIAEGRPWVFLALFLFGNLLISILTDVVLAAILMLPLYRAFAENAGIKPYDRLNSVFLTGILCASSLGDIAMPFKFMPIIFWKTFTSLTGLPVDFSKHVFVVFPAVVAILLVYVLACRYVVRPDVSVLKNIASLECFNVRATKIQKINLSIIGMLLVSLILPSILPKDFFITEFFARLGYAGTVFAFLLVMMTVKVDGKSLISIGELAKDFDWAMFLLLVFFIPLATALPSDQAGIKESISLFVQPILSDLSSYMLVVVLILMVTVLTNFLNNMIVALIFVSILASLNLEAMGLNIVVLAVMILCSSVYAMFSPAASPVSAFIFSQKDLITFRAHCMHGLKCCAVIVLFSVTVVYWYLMCFM